jgi:hypothetical protein
MSYKFTSGEILTADKLNQAISGRRLTVHGSGGSSIDADGDTIRVDGYENIYIRLTEKHTANSTVKYGWKEVYRNANGAWQNATFNGTANGDYAVEINNANLPTGNIVYRAERSPESGELLFKSSGLLSTDIKGKDIVLMILGTEEEYDTCANAPAASPGCWQGYAWAAYKVCGYTYTKLFDARDLGKWALELNGGTTSAWRRFHPAFWGWDSYTEGLPTAANACEGVRFIGSGSSALDCNCPDWLSSITCLKFSVNYKTEEEVDCDPTDTERCDCDSSYWTGFTAAMTGYWGTTQTTVACVDGSCLWTTDNGPFGLSFIWEEVPRGEPDCDWGPPTFDPCDPCAGFSRFVLSVNRSSASGGDPGNLFSTYRIGYAALKGLIDDCSTGPIQLELVSHQTNACPDVINWIKVECCTANETANCTP